MFTHDDFANLWGKIAKAKHAGYDVALAQIELAHLQDTLMGRKNNGRLDMLIMALQELKQNES